jgi:hypothetical protein
VRFAAERGGKPRTGFEPGQPLVVTVRFDTEPGAPRRVDLRAAVVGPFDIPIWIMTAEEVALPGGRCEVDFVVPAVPDLLGSLAVSVGVTDSESGGAVTAKRFDEMFAVAGRHEHGLIDVAYSVPTDVRRT